MMNMVAITGRTTADIELKETQNGKSYIFFQVACDRDYKNSDGERETDFVPCVAWGKTAELMDDLVPKGSLTTIAGRFEAQGYEDGEGNRKFVNQVNVNKFYLLESRDKNGDQWDYDNEH